MLRRHFFIFWSLAALLVPAQAAMSTDDPLAVADNEVSVQRSGASFTVDVTLFTPVPPALAWAVLTDFDHMASFVPNLSSSQVLERSDTLLKVAQKGVARYGFFSVNLESVREISLSPQYEIRAHNVSGNVKSLDSVLQLQAEGSGTRLHYHAEVVPGFWFPPLIGPSLVRHETAEQFSAMLREMLRRQ